MAVLMNVVDVEELLMAIETALVSIFSNLDPATPLDMRDGGVLALENILQ